jgi:HNH endonuclease
MVREREFAPLARRSQELGGLGPLAPEACRRLACDSALTRVLVTRNPDHDPATPILGEGGGLAGRLQTARTLLPPALGGPPTARCDRPVAWCEGHHLWHWVDGGPTDLPNLALICRTHHRAVHEGGWQLQRAPDGRFTATPPHRRPRSAA